VFGGTSSPTITVFSSTGIAGRILLRQNVTVNSTLTSGTAQILNGGSDANSGFIDLDDGTRIFDVNNGTASVDFLVTASIQNGGLTKNGAGAMQVAAANTFSGNTTVEEGNLTVFGDNALQNTGNVVITGGTLLLNRSTNGTSSIVNDAANFVLGNSTGGGTLKLDVGIDEQVGTLTLSGNSTIDLNEVGTIRFLASASIGWEAGAELSIRNWISGSTGIFVGTVSDSTSLTTGQLAQIRGYGPGDVDLGLASFGTDGELIFSPIPEPGTVAVVLLLGLFLAWRERRVLAVLIFRCRPIATGLSGRNPEATGHIARWLREVT
jgi:fibronectin-binding autotransporter adhesin